MLRSGDAGDGCFDGRGERGESSGKDEKKKARRKTIERKNVGVGTELGQWEWVLKWNQVSFCGC